MSAQPYDWAAEPDLRPVPPSAPLEDALYDVAWRWITGPWTRPMTMQERVRRLAHELATVAMPFGVAEALRRIEEVKTSLLGPELAATVQEALLSGQRRGGEREDA